MKFEKPNEENRKDEFSRLFEKLTGLKPEDTTVGEDGWLFIPKNAELSKRKVSERERLMELSGSNGWRNNLTNGQCDGWWIRPTE